MSELKTECFQQCGAENRRNILEAFWAEDWWRGEGYGKHGAGEDDTSQAWCALLWILIFSPRAGETYWRVPSRGMPCSDLFSHWESEAPEHLTPFVLPGDFLLMQQQLWFLSSCPQLGMESHTWADGWGQTVGERLGVGLTLWCVHGHTLGNEVIQRRARKSGEYVCRGRESSRTPLIIINREGYMTPNPALHSNQAIQWSSNSYYYFLHLQIPPPTFPCWNPVLLVRPSSCIMHDKLLQSCLTLCDPVDCSPLGSSVHGTLQVRILKWAALPSSRGSSWPRDQTGGVSHVSCIGRWVLYPECHLGLS